MEMRYFSIFCRSGGEAEGEEKNKVLPHVRESWRGREEGSTTAFTRLLPSSSKQMGFPKVNVVNRAGYVCSVKIKGS